MNMLLEERERIHCDLRLYEAWMPNPSVHGNSCFFYKGTASLKS